MQRVVAVFGAVVVEGYVDVVLFEARSVAVVDGWWVYSVVVAGVGSGSSKLLFPSKSPSSRYSSDVSYVSPSVISLFALLVISSRAEKFNILNCYIRFSYSWHKKT